MEPIESQRGPLRLPSSISTRLLFIVWLLDSVAFIWLIVYIAQHGSTPDATDLTKVLGGIWGATAVSLIGPFWKTIKLWPAMYKKLVLTGVLTIVAVAGILLWIRARQTARLEMLFKEDRELELNAAPKMQHVMQLQKERGNAKTLPEYLQWCAEMEPALNDYESVERQVDKLLGQMQQEIGGLRPRAGYGTLLPGFAVLRELFAMDMEVAQAERKEIGYAKQLSNILPADRIQFYNANIRPNINQEVKIAQDEVEILKDAKRRGITLPESVYQRAGIVQGGQAAGKKTTLTEPNTQGGPFSAGSPKQTFEEWEKETH